MSGSCRGGAWLAAAATLLAFAAISGYHGWIGQATCGCFGVIKASPWHAFAVDVTALVSLAVGRPNVGPIRNIPRSELVRSRGAYLLAGSIVLLTALTALAAWVYHSPAAALARLRGEALTVTPSYVDFGQGEAGQVLEATVEVRNWTDNPIRLIGGTSDCSCVVTDSLPATIPAGEAKVVTIRLKLPRSNAGVLTRTAELWTDCDRQRSIRLLAGCRVGG